MKSLKCQGPGATRLPRGHRAAPKKKIGIIKVKKWPLVKDKNENYSVFYIFIFIQNAEKPELQVF